MGFVLPLLLLSPNGILNYSCGANPPKADYLTVYITNSGYTLVTDNAALEPVQVPLAASGDYDRDRLLEALDSAAHAWGMTTESIIVSAAPGVDPALLSETLDLVGG